MKALPLNSVHYVMLNKAHDLARLGQNLLMSYCNVAKRVPVTPTVKGGVE